MRLGLAGQDRKYQKQGRAEMQGRIQVRSMRRRRGDELRGSAYGMLLARTQGRNKAQDEEEKDKRDSRPEAPEAEEPITPESENFRFPGEEAPEFAPPFAGNFVPSGRSTPEPNWDLDADLPAWEESTDQDRSAFSPDFAPATPTAPVAPAATAATAATAAPAATAMRAAPQAMPDFVDPASQNFRTNAPAQPAIVAAPANSTTAVTSNAGNTFAAEAEAASARRQPNNNAQMRTERVVSRPETATAATPSRAQAAQQRPRSERQATPATPAAAAALNPNVAPAQEAPTTRKGTTSPATQVIRPSSAPRRNAAAAMAAATLSTEASAMATEATTTDADADAAATVPKGGRLEAVAAEEAAERAARRKAAQEAARAANEWHVVSGEDFVEGWGMPNGERDSITARMKRAQKHLRERGLSIPDGDIGARTQESTMRAWQRGAGIGAAAGVRQAQAQGQRGGNQRLPKRHVIAAVVIFFLALAFELLGFNSAYLFFDSERYVERQIDLPVVAQVQRQGVIINSNSPQLALNNIDQEVRNVYLEVDLGPRALVHGSLLYTDEARQFAPTVATRFAVVANARRSGSSGDHEEQGASAGVHNAVYMQLLAEGVTHNLWINFEPQEVAQGLLITKVVLNKRPPLDCSVVRVLLLMGALSLIYALGFSAIRQRKIVVDGPVYKLLNRSILGLQLLLVTLIFWQMSPQQATDAGFQTPALGVLPYSTSERELLRQMPTSVNEFLMEDAYTQQLHAWLHHQVALAMAPDPRLAQMQNVYDPTERLNHKEVPYLWDRAYFEGKYYVAEGVAPLLTIYLPIYALTGKVPCAALASYIATLYALLALYLLSNRFLRVLTLRCNPLLFVVSKLAFFGCSWVVLLQLSFLYYNLSHLTAIAFLALSLALALSIARFVPGRYPGDDNWMRLMHSQGKSVENEPLVLQKWHALGQACKEHVWTQPWWCALELLLCAQSIALVVAAQPFMVPFALILVGAMLWGLLRSTGELKTKAVASVALVVPLVVAVGALLWYNQLRFGSPWDFGGAYVLNATNNQAYGLGVQGVLAQWQDLLFHVLNADWSFTGHFPYVQLHQTTDLSTGRQIAQQAHLGLLALPFIWAVALVVLMVRRLRAVNRLHQQWVAARDSGKAVSAPPQSAAQMALYQGITWSFVLSIVICPVLLFFKAAQGTWQWEMIAESSMVLGLIAFIAIMMLSFSDVRGERSDASAHRAIAYIMLLGLGLSTVVLSFFLKWSGATLLPAINPDFYLQLQETFNALSFARNLH